MFMELSGDRSDENKSIMEMSMKYETDSFKIIIFAYFTSHIHSLSIPSEFSHISFFCSIQKLDLFNVFIPLIKIFGCFLHDITNKQLKVLILYTLLCVRFQLFFR